MTHVPCCLCGRQAHRLRNPAGGYFYPELYCTAHTFCRSVAECFHPLCGECTLSAEAQDALLFSTDAERVQYGTAL